MRLLLSLTVTLSFLAGQTCGQGVSVFYPLEIIEGEVMSRMVVQCDMEQDQAVDQSASSDCGVGKCVSQGAQEPESAVTIAIHDDVIIATSDISYVVSPLQIAYVDYPSAEGSITRPLTVVRRE